MSTNVPEMSIARGASLGAPSGTVYSGAPIGSLDVRTPPPQHQPGMAASGARRQRALGLIPVQPGGMHPMITRGPTKVHVSAAEVSKTRADLRRARSAVAAAEAAFISTAPAQGSAPSDAHKDATLKARDANALVAALVRKLAEMEAASVSRPLRIVLATVREPAEVAAELASHETAYVCLHDGCRGDRWADEAAMRRAHPTDAEMKQRQQCHVFALLCDAPLDPLDPEGERIGYVAPVGSDGTTVRAAVAQAEDGDERDEKIAALETALAEVRGLLDGLTKGKPARTP